MEKEKKITNIWSFFIFFYQTIKIFNKKKYIHIFKIYIFIGKVLLRQNPIGKNALKSDSYKLILLKDRIKQKVMREAEEAVIKEDLERRVNDKKNKVGGGEGFLSFDPYKKVYR